MGSAIVKLVKKVKEGGYSSKSNVKYQWGGNKVEDISPNTLEAAKTLSRVASQKPKSIEEEAKQVHLDSLLAQRIAKEEELNEQQKKRRAQVHLKAQHYTDEDWDLISAKIEAWMLYWKLYPKSSVHVLDLTNGKTVYMFVDKVYPIRATLLERMLRHRLTVPPSYCRDVVIAGNVIQTVQAGLRESYECLASVPIACTARQMVFSSPWLTAKKESGSPLQTALVLASLKRSALGYRPFANPLCQGWIALSKRLQLLRVEMALSVVHGPNLSGGPRTDYSRVNGLTISAACCVAAGYFVCCCCLLCSCCSSILLPQEDLSRNLELTESTPSVGNVQVAFLLICFCWFMLIYVSAGHVSRSCLKEIESADYGFCWLQASWTPVMHCTTLPSHSRFLLKKCVSLSERIHMLSIDIHSKIVILNRVLRIILEILPEHPSDTKVFTVKMEILLEPTSNKLLVGEMTLEDELRYTKSYVPTISNENYIPDILKPIIRNLECRPIHEGRPVSPESTKYDNIQTLFQIIKLLKIYELHEGICPRFLLEFYSSIEITKDDDQNISLTFWALKRTFKFSLESFASILSIPCEGECSYSEESSLDYPIWEVIQRGNGPVSVSTDTNGQIKVLPPKTAEEILARERERKARTTLLMAIPEDHLAKFHKMTDAKEMWEAIKSRFGGNDESKKMQKYILKQQFEGFSVSNSEGLHKGYDRFQSLLSQLKIHGAGVSTKDANQKFLYAFPSSLSPSSTGSSSSAQNVAFVSSESTSSTNDVSTAYGATTSSGYNSQRENSSSYTDELVHSFFVIY
ncbi:hypothetical protein Tco_0762785 [Tanacetum coccineum]